MHVLLLLKKKSLYLEDFLDIPEQKFWRNRIFRFLFRNSLIKWISLGFSHGFRLEMLHITRVHILDKISVPSDQFPWFLGNRKFMFRDFCLNLNSKSFLRSVFRFFSQKPGIYPYVKFHGGFENDNHFCQKYIVFAVINPKVVKNSKNQWFSWIHATYRCSFSQIRIFPYERPVDS